MTAEGSDDLFLQLVLLLQQSAWLALGKIQNPETGRAEVDLPRARHAIDMLGMLERKCAGNLSPEEQGLLSNALTQLRLNYVETQDTQDRSPASEPGGAEPADGGSPPADSAAE